MRLSLVVILLLLLAACEGGSSSEFTGGVINWDRDPATVVFRADVKGGNAGESFLARNNIPLCTIYGDNRVVWTNDLGDFNTQVLWDRVTDQQIQDFVAYLTVVKRIFTQGSGLSQQPPSAEQPVYEIMTVFVNERQHTTDSLSGWEPDYFQDIVNYCRNISRAPVLYEPPGGWVSVRGIEYDPNRPSLFWEGAAAGLRLGELVASGEPRWVSGQNAVVLWNFIRTSSPIIQFVEGEAAYELVLEVPGVHPGAAAAP